jgi:hypothetical protein
VDDLDTELASLAERSISAGAVETISGAGRKATVVDPDGNSIALAQVGDAAGSRRARDGG